MQPQALRATEMRYFPPGVGDEVREPGWGRSLVDRRRVTCPGVHVASTPTQLPGLVLESTSTPQAADQGERRRPPRDGRASPGQRHVSAIGARLPQRLDGRLGFAQVRCDETPSVVLAVATTGAARLWSTGSATLVFRSPSLRAAVALVRRVPRRCMGAREGPPPGPPSRAVRSRGDQRRAVDGRVAKGLCSRSQLSSMTRASGMSDRVSKRPAAGMSAANPRQERHKSGHQAAVAVARRAGHAQRSAMRCTAMPWRGLASAPTVAR